MRKYVLRFLIIYKRIANAYTRCRRITNPTERETGAPNDPNTCTCFVKWVHLFSLARLDLQSNRNEYKHF